MDKKLLYQIFISSLVLTVLIIAFTNNSFDYKQYEVQWRYFLESGNPWRWGSNTYGPLHGLFAYLHIIYSKLPRMIFSLIFLVASYLIAKELLISSAFNFKYKRFLLILIFLNPLYWIFSVVFGCNDAFVAGLTVFGIILYRKEKQLMSAICVSIAVLMKFIPIIIIPFLAFYEGKIRWKFLLSSIGFILGGFYLSYLKWGGMVFHPFRVSAGREAKLLSIFRFFSGEYSFFDSISNQQIDIISTQIIAYGLIIIFFIYLITNLKNQLIFIGLAFAFLFAFYKVGHFQFYMSLELILFLIIGNLSIEKPIHKVLLNAIYFFIAWFGILTISFAATEGYYKDFEFLRDIISLPHFIAILILMTSLLNYVLKGYKIEIKVRNSLY